MTSTRLTGYAPRMQALARDVAQISGPCVGCKDCNGLCEQLLDTICLPDLILRGRGE